MKLMQRCLIFACVFGCVVCKILPIPAYITPCNRNDPNLDECTTKNGQAALATFVKGDRKYKVPVLDPLVIEELSILNGNGSVAIDMIAKNIQLIGFKDITLKSSNFDLAKKVITLKMFMPLLYTLGDYEIKGNIFILPINGNGFSNITQENVEMTYTLNYNLVKKADGLEYVVPYNNTMSVTTTKAHIHFDNLFNGDKLLSDNMNNFMNDNWEIMNVEMSPAVGAAIGNILQQILGNLFKDIPYNAIFLNN